MRVGVLASGEGTNFEHLVLRLRVSRRAEVVRLICNVPGAGVVARAHRLGVPATILSHQAATSRAAFDATLAEALVADGVELTCLAGYLRLLGPQFLAAMNWNVINVHPSLLPAFPGLHAARQALAAKATQTGCTVHYVEEGLDTGAIIAQATVPILVGDSEESLVARIHAAEHDLYPAVVERLADDKTPARAATRPIG